MPFLAWGTSAKREKYEKKRTAKEILGVILSSSFFTDCYIDGHLLIAAIDNKREFVPYLAFFDNLTDFS